MALSLSVSVTGSSTVTLNWSMTGVTSGNYPWYIDLTGPGSINDPQSGSLYSTSSKSGSATVTGLSASTSYTWGATVTYQSGNVGGPSTTASGTTQAGVATYSITWDLAGGSGGSGYTYSVTAGNSVPAPTSNPTQSGYNFTGWSVSFPYTPSGNATITAGWSPVPATYSGSWNLDGGSGGGPYPGSVTAGQSISAPSTPTKAGNNFAGWSVSFPYTPSGSGWSITAYWSPVVTTYTITWDLAGGSGGSGYTASVTAGNSVSAPSSNPTRSGYNFAGWSVSFPYTPSGNATITASWTPVVVVTTGYLQVYNGTSWVQVPVNVYNGSTWVEAPVYVYNGTTWVVSQ